MDDERHYLQTCLDSAQAAVVLVRDANQVVGASTCLPLRDEENSSKAPLSKLGFDTDKVFYLAESVLDKNYRGQGVGVRFFEEREAYVRELGGFEYTCFCAAQRAAEPPPTTCRLHTAGSLLAQTRLRADRRACQIHLAGHGRHR